MHEPYMITVKNISITTEIYETMDQNGKSTIYPVYVPTPKFKNVNDYILWIELGAP